MTNKLLNALALLCVASLAGCAASRPDNAAAGGPHEAHRPH